MRLSVVESFTRTPGGRYRHQGPNSGQQFREEVLAPAFEEAERNGAELVVDLDGGYGYATSFLEEAFGGLARQKGVRAVESILCFVSKEEPYLIDDLKRYIEEATRK
jgi:uncharacterized protein DUF4325